MAGIFSTAEDNLSLICSSTAGRYCGTRWAIHHLIVPLLEFALLDFKVGWFVFWEGAGRTWLDVITYVTISDTNNRILVLFITHNPLPLTESDPECEDDILSHARRDKKEEKGIGLAGCAAEVNV